MTGNRDLGVHFVYHKWDGRIRRKYSYVPKGDLSRLGEFVESLHETPLSVGLFVPFPAAWKAVKEFMGERTDRKREPGKAEFYCLDTDQQVDAFWDFVRVLSKLST